MHIQPFVAPTPPCLRPERALEALEGLTPDGAVELRSRWRHDAEEYGASFNLTRAGVVVIGSTTGFRRLDETGEVRHQGEPEHFFGAPPSPRPDGGFYVSHVSSVEAFDANGEGLWRRSPSEGLSTVTTSGPEGNLYVADHATFYAYGPQGNLLWSKPVQPAWTDTRPALDERGNLYYPARDGTVYSWTPSGEERWRFEGLKAEGFFSPLKTGLGVGPDGTVLVGAEDGQLHALRDGRELWARPLGSRKLEQYDTPAVDPQGRIYASSGEAVIAFDADGQELWRKEKGATLHLTADPRGGVVLGIRGGPLHGLAPDGRLRWSLTEGNTYQRPVFGPQGELYTSTSGRYIVSVRPPQEQSVAETLEKACQDPGANPQVHETERGILVGGVWLPRRHPS